MLERIKRLDAGQPVRRIIFFHVCYLLTRLGAGLIYLLHVERAERVPRDGGLLVVSNHQSYLDPPLVGVGIAIGGRHIVPIARQGLFGNRAFAWLMRNLNSISINEKQGDAVALRRAVKELDAGRCVLIFPEGTRTPDGAMRPFKRGTWLLVSRAECPVLPVAIEGAYDAWPRTRKYPRLWGKRIAVKVGEPVSHDRLLAMGPEAALQFLAAEVESMRRELRTRLRRESGGRYPAPGPGDQGASAGAGA